MHHEAVLHSASFLFNSEPVAGAPDGFNVFGGRGGGLDFFPEAVDVDHDGGRVSHGIQAPYLVKELVLAEHNTGIFRQEQQQLKFLIGKGNLLPLVVHHMGFRLDFQVAPMYGLDPWGGVAV